jgi:hypothetical protein
LGPASKGVRVSLPGDQELVSVSQHIDKDLRQQPKPLVPGKRRVYLVTWMESNSQIQIIPASKGGEKEQQKR